MARIYNKNWNKNNTISDGDDFIMESSTNNSDIRSRNFIFEGPITSNNDVGRAMSYDRMYYTPDDDMEPLFTTSIDDIIDPVVLCDNEFELQKLATTMTKSISKVSNMIRDILRDNMNAFDTIYHGDMTHNDFYIKLGNSIWQSLLQLFNINRNDANNPDYIFTVDDDHDVNTLRFLDRVYNDPDISYETNPIDTFYKYSKKFGVSGAITFEWTYLLANKLRELMPMLNDNDINELILLLDNNGILVRDGIKGDMDCDKCHCDSPGNIDDEDDELYDDDIFIHIDISQIGDDLSEVAIEVPGGDTVRLYKNLNEVDINDKYTWDWLRHFKPIVYFITDNEEEYLQYNNTNDEGILKFVKLMDSREFTHEADDTTSVIGVYYIGDSVYELSDVELHQVGVLIEDSMVASPAFSHLYATMNDETFMVSESDIAESIYDISGDDNDEDDEDEDENDVEYDDETESIMDYAASLISANDNTDIEYIYEDDEDEDDEDIEEFTTSEEVIDEYDDITSDELVFQPVRKDRSKYKNV